MQKFLTQYLWIAVLASILATFTDHKIIPEPGTWNILELRSLDSRFLFKKKPEINATKDIVLIVIDDESYRNIDKPIIFYHKYICDIINYLVDSGAKVIGLDIELPSISLEKDVIGGYESIFRTTFLRARNKGVDVVIGCSNKKRLPLQQYLDVAGPDNLSMFNLTTDADAFRRRQRLWSGDEGSRMDSFPFLLAKKYSDKLAFPAKEILIDYSLSHDFKKYFFYDILQLIKSDLDHTHLFRDKVIIIGSLLSSEDRHPTPLYYSHSQINDKMAKQHGEDTGSPTNYNSLFQSKDKWTEGVIIQATTLNTLLSKSYFSEPERHTEFMGIFIMSLLTLFLCFKYRPLIAAFLCIGQSMVVFLSRTMPLIIFTLFGLSPYFQPF